MDRNLTADIELGSKIGAAYEVNAQYEPPPIRPTRPERCGSRESALPSGVPLEKRSDGSIFDGIKIQREVTIC